MVGSCRFPNFQDRLFPEKFQKFQAEFKAFTDRPTWDGFQQQVADILEIFVNATCSTSYVYIYICVCVLYIFIHVTHANR